MTVGSSRVRFHLLVLIALLAGCVLFGLHMPLAKAASPLAASASLKAESPLALPSGTILREFKVPYPNIQGRAIAFDGTNLWTSSYGPNIYELSTRGTLLKTVPTGFDVGALAWDRKRQVLWAGSYDGLGNFYQINPTSGTATYQFTFLPFAAACYSQGTYTGYIDGLAYDPAYDNLWISGDSTSPVYNVTVAGSPLSSFPVTPIRASGCNSGITVETGKNESLWLSTFDFYGQPPSYENPTGLAGTPESGAFSEGSAYSTEGIAYDDVTFSPNCAVWSNDSSSSTALGLVTAWQVSCPTPPPYAHAWYISDPSGLTMQSRGASDGSWDSANCSQNQKMAVLDFGQVSNNGDSTIYQGYGTNDFASGSPFITDAQVVTATVAYVQGWASTAGTCPQLKVVIGTNNFHECPGFPSGTCTTNGAGAAWAHVVDNVRYYLSQNGYMPQITAHGGDDAETDGSFDCAGPTDGFINAFNQNTSTHAGMVDFGTAWLSLNCWASSDVYYVAYGVAADVPLPEIYTQPAMNSWISLRTTGNGGGPYVINFLGVLTECTGADPLPTANCPVQSFQQWAPIQAWNNFWNTLTSNSVGQAALYFSTNIKRQ